MMVEPGNAYMGRAQVDLQVAVQQRQGAEIFGPITLPLCNIFGALRNCIASLLLLFTHTDSGRVNGAYDYFDLSPFSVYSRIISVQPAEQNNELACWPPYRLLADRLKSTRVMSTPEFGDRQKYRLNHSMDGDGDHDDEPGHQPQEDQVGANVEGVVGGPGQPTAPGTENPSPSGEQDPGGTSALGAGDGGQTVEGKNTLVEYSIHENTNALDNQQPPAQPPTQSPAPPPEEMANRGVTLGQTGGAHQKKVSFHLEIEEAPLLAPEQNPQGASQPGTETSQNDNLQVPFSNVTPLSFLPDAATPPHDQRKRLGHKRNSEWVFRPLKLKFKVKELEELYKNYVYRQQQSLVFTACLIMVALSVMVVLAFFINVKVHGGGGGGEEKLGYVFLFV